MRIGFDRQIFTIQKHGGISRYFTDLYLEIHKEPGITAELLFSRHQNTYLHERGIGERLNPLAVRAYARMMAATNHRVRLNSHTDIHHSTFYFGRPKKIKDKTKLVSTLYDMIPESFPQYFNENPHFNKLDWLKASDLVISISDAATADLSYFQPKIANQIRRIHLYSGFTDDSPQSKPSEFDHESGSYILFVGKRDSYKNAQMLLRSFAASEPKRHGHKLIFAGGGPFSKGERANHESLGISSYVRQVNVNDKVLWYLYRHANAVVVPSIAEGFSLPLVEGLSADVPVICSDIPVHREVAGDFAVRVNALQHKDWADILGSVSSLKRPSEALGKETYKLRCHYFSKERMAQEHAQAYMELLS